MIEGIIEQILSEYAVEGWMAIGDELEEEDEIEENSLG